MRRRRQATAFPHHRVQEELPAQLLGEQRRGGHQKVAPLLYSLLG